MREIWKSVSIWRIYGQKFGGMFFWLTVYTCMCCNWLIDTPVCRGFEKQISLFSNRRLDILSASRSVWEDIQCGGIIETAVGIKSYQ